MWHIMQYCSVGLRCFCKRLLDVHFLPPCKEIKFHLYVIPAPRVIPAKAGIQKVAVSLEIAIDKMLNKASTATLLKGEYREIICKQYGHEYNYRHIVAIWRTKHKGENLQDLKPERSHTNGDIYIF